MHKKIVGCFCLLTQRRAPKITFNLHQLICTSRPVLLVRIRYTQFMRGILKTSSRTPMIITNFKKTVAFYDVILLQKYRKWNQCLSFFSKPCILNCSMQNLIVPVVKCKCGLNCINCFYKIILASKRRICMALHWSVDKISLK